MTPPTQSNTTPTSTDELVERLRRANELAQEIQQLEARAREKRELLETLVGPGSLGMSKAAKPKIEGEASATSKILAAMKARKGEQLSGEQIAELIESEKVETVRALLNRLSKKGKVKRVKWGRYQYPG
jgi:chromatin segregation and condensation protein Rec8/ScpA/Scc1 (kleisin family)